MKNHAIVSYLSFTVAMFTASAFAGAGFDWTGASGNLWTNAANWELVSGDDEDGVPDADDDVWFQATGSFAGGVMLDGDRECNSVNFNNDVKFTLGTTNDTLTISSGAVNSLYVNAKAEQVIACNLQLNSPDGTNSWCLHRQWEWNVPSDQLRIDGRVTTSGIIRFYSTNSGRHGKVTFKNTGHSFGGGPFLDGGSVEVNGCLYTDVFGDYPITFGNTGALVLRGFSQTITNTIDTTAAIGAVSFYPYSATITLATDIYVPADATLTFGTSGASLMKLDPGMTIAGPGKMELMRDGVAFTSVNQFTDGNFNIGQAGGSMIFDGITWGDFTNHYSKGYGTGNLQWRVTDGGGFAAHGQALEIDAPWVDSWFANTSITIGPMGGSVDDATIRNYCDAPVIIKTDVILANRRTFYSNTAPYAPGIDGTHQPITNLNTFAGSVTGVGAPRFEGRTTGTLNDEIVFAGTNNCWTGSQYGDNHYGAGNKNSSLNSGPGGIITHQRSSALMLVQFASPESLPTGNGGALAWLAATSRYGGSQGYLMAGKEGGALYNLTDGYRYLMGSNDGTTIGILGSSGEAGTSATLAGDMVCLHSGSDGHFGQFRFVVRGPSECFAGAPDAPLAFAPTYGFDDGNIDNGLAGAASTVSPSESGARYLYKRGDGTVVLQNVAYTTYDGEGDTSERFVWHIGEDGTLGGLRYNKLPGRNWRYFDGAVRETGTNLWNSTVAFPIYFCGGVIELDGVDFRRNLSASPAVGEASLVWGGGFAAHGSDAVVEINEGAKYVYNDNGTGFNRADRGLFFGSRTANATVLFKNDLDMGKRTPYIMTVRGEGRKPEVRIEGQVSNGGFVMTYATTRKGEVIPAGALELAHPNNIFDNKVDIEAGTLLVSGAISNGTANVTVMNGGALGGTGIVKRPVVVNAGGALAPGNLGTGRLTIAGNLTMAEGAVYEYEENAGARDLVALEGGKLTLPATGTVRLAQKVYGNRTLVTGAGSVAGAGATDLSGWTVEGVDNAAVCHVELRGSDLVLCGVPPGTVMMLK